MTVTGQRIETPSRVVPGGGPLPVPEGADDDRGALERHRNHNADESVLRDMVARAEDAGAKYVYYQVVTLGARIISKVAPVRHLSAMAERGVRFHGTALSDQHTDRHGNLLGGGMHAREFTVLPDLDTFAVLPWDTSVARFFCTAYEPEHLPETGGRPLATDSRGLLVRRHAAFEAATGLELRSGCEPEMTWSGPGMEVSVPPGSASSYQLENLERMRPIYQRIIDYAVRLGLDMVEGDYEDPGQLELNFMYDRAELTADRLITYRQICRQVAREFGVAASFMPKPATGAMGNGCHHNLSLWRGGQNVFTDDRRELHLSELGRHALGGILKHAPGSMAIMASTVNSYKRFWDTGMFAPSHVNWGYDNRTCTVRVPANGRLEFKLPDASVNPYLSHLLLLAAIRDGLENRLDPGEPQEGTTDGTSREHKQLPLTMGEALEAFRKDTVMWSALPAETAEVYASVKYDEWARACGAVTEWDRQMYFDAIP